MKISKKAKSAKSLKPVTTYPRTAGDVFVTQKMLYSVRDELKEQIFEIKSELKTEIHEVKASIHRIELLVEEQNNRNKIVLDGLSQLFIRQDRIEKEIEGRSS